MNANQYNWALLILNGYKWLGVIKKNKKELKWFKTIKMKKRIIKRINRIKSLRDAFEIFNVLM